MPIFNRSHYEDVLAVQILELWKKAQLPDRVLQDSRSEFFRKRYRQIRQFEEYLYENGYRVVKVFLNVSKEEQGKRFLERIEKPEKNWKFASSDLETRARFDDYIDLYEEVIRRPPATIPPGMFCLPTRSGTPATCSVRSWWMCCRAAIPGFRNCPRRSAPTWKRPGNSCSGNRRTDFFPSKPLCIVRDNS